jgi:predicted Zn-dependent protease
VKVARTLWRRSVDLARQAGQRERAGLYLTGAAICEAWAGNRPEARQTALEVLELGKGRDEVYGAALALALAGDSGRAQALADALDARFPEDTSVRFIYLPVLRAVFALNRGEPPEAIEALQAAAPYELAVPGTDFYAFFGGLYPAYLRGRPLLAARRPAEASAEFQKILDHPGIVLADPVGALAQLELGRAYALAGDRARAKAAYEAFLGLWKDADPDVPVLQQAKAGYARLR